MAGKVPIYLQSYTVSGYGYGPTLLGTHLCTLGMRSGKRTEACVYMEQACVCVCVCICVHVCVMCAS
jgi:hypothetical protein